MPWVGFLCLSRRQGMTGLLSILFMPDSTKRTMRPGEESQKGREVSLLFLFPMRRRGKQRIPARRIAA